jgi:hypothetical protein
MLLWLSRGRLLGPPPGLTRFETDAALALCAIACSISDCGIWRSIGYVVPARSPKRDIGSAAASRQIDSRVDDVTYDHASSRAIGTITSSVISSATFDFFHNAMPGVSEARLSVAGRLLR